MIYRYRRPEVHQEDDVLPWGKIVIALGATVLISAALVAWAWSAMTAKQHELRPTGVFPERELGPRRPVMSVQEGLFEDRGVGQLRLDEQRRRLEQPSWADEARRTVNVPIDQAMDLVIEENKR